MLKDLIKGLLAGIAIKLLDNYRHLSIKLFKIEAAKSYLQSVQIARLSALGLMQLGLVIALICLGTVLFHAGLFTLLPWTVKAKALLGMFLGLAYVISGSVALGAAMNEKIWMEKSGATKMLEEATSQSKENG
ncbi:MAG: hypothetical protein A2283_16350 [Lentisphaerae bacterium RIFOXYA12_FULL_48_11]|nr:MAG: hypothetical protein A2283_16350 [Lentisphaerae bacterium RIFOXYA12_FULL_48_11]